MNILETIIEKKKIEVQKKMELRPISELENSSFFKEETLSFRKFLLDKNKTSIITEFKRKSPSKGIINISSTVKEVTGEYVKYGASAVSVLTDEEFFGGSLNDLMEVRINKIPILRKDFIVDEYQIIESKSYGADVILLIAACLSKEEVKRFSKFAKNLGLHVLLEIHNENELEHVCDDADVIGINNRDLKSFKVDINRSIELCKKIPADKIKISESGIDDPKIIEYLKQNGFSGFLIGEKFMKEKNPGKAFSDFVKELNELENNILKQQLY